MDCTFRTEQGKFNYRVGAIIICENKILMVKSSREPYCYSVGGDINKMKRRLLSLIILTMTTVLLMSCSKSVNVQQVPNSVDTNKNIDGYKISQSQDGKKEIYCTEDKKLILVYDDSEKVIYENYKDITTNPYSIWSFDEYKIQWSSDGNYVYIVDSIYDLNNNNLIPIKDCVVFSWIDNKGVYLAEGTHYEISYDGGLQNEMAVGKKVKVIESGEIKEKGKQTDDRYFVLDHFIDVDKVFEVVGDYIIVDTASLKYREEELQEKIEEDFRSNKFREFLKQNKEESLNMKYMVLIDAIRESKEFQQLKYQINDLEQSYPIEFEGDIKELIKIINDSTYCSYNVSGKYYLRDIKEEEVEFR